MMKQLVFLLVVAMAASSMADDASQSQQPTEEEVNEAVFEISKEMVAEVNDAVKIINEVFGYPACEEADTAQRGLSAKRAAIQRRGSWGKVWRGAAKGVCNAFGLRDAESAPGLRAVLRKRDGAWGKVWQGATSGACKALEDRDAESAPGQDGGEDPQDETQFQADVAKLKEAVTVLNEVLIVAEAAAQN